METPNEQGRFEEFLSGVGQGIDDIESNLARREAIEVLEALDRVDGQNHRKLVNPAQLQYRLHVLQETKKRLGDIAAPVGSVDEAVGRLNHLVNEAMLRVKEEIQRTSADSPNVLAFNSAVNNISSLTLRAINSVLDAEQTVFDLLDEGSGGQRELQHKLQFMEDVSLRFLQRYLAEELANNRDLAKDCRRDDLAVLNEALFEVDALTGGCEVAAASVADYAIRVVVANKGWDGWDLSRSIRGFEKCVVGYPTDEGIAALNLLMAKLEVFRANPRPSDEAAFRGRGWKKEALGLLEDAVQKVGAWGKGEITLRNLPEVSVPSAIVGQLLQAQDMVNRCWQYLNHMRRIVEVVGRMIADNDKPLGFIARYLRCEKAIEMIAEILKSDHSIGYSVRMPDLDGVRSNAMQETDPSRPAEEIRDGWD